MQQAAMYVCTSACSIYPSPPAPPPTPPHLSPWRFPCLSLALSHTHSCTRSQLCTHLYTHTTASTQSALSTSHTPPMSLYTSISHVSLYINASCLYIREWGMSLYISKSHVFYIMSPVSCTANLISATHTATHSTATHTATHSTATHTATHCSRDEIRCTWDSVHIRQPVRRVLCLHHIHQSCPCVYQWVISLNTSASHVPVYMNESCLLIHQRVMSLNTFMSHGFDVKSHVSIYSESRLCAHCENGLDRFAK